MTFYSGEISCPRTIQKLAKQPNLSSQLTMETPILYFCIAILYTEYVVELLWGGGGGELFMGACRRPCPLEILDAILT